MSQATNQQEFDRASQVLVGGVNSAVRAFRAVGGTPRFIQRAEGARMWDVEGKAYIDYVGSWGPAIVGHSHPEVLKAVQAAVADGLSFGAPNVRETELAQKMCDMFPHVERVRFTSSGTESTMSALRLARGYTGRNRIIKFEGCYHGTADSLLVKAGSGALAFGNPEDVVKHTLIARYNDLDSVRRLFEQYPDDVACLIVEPIPGNMNMMVPQPGFLEGLRELCTQYGAVLIFDEVMSGFRVTLTGAQGWCGITPDLSTFGKVIGGGMPVGAVAGPARIMERFAPLGNVYQAGTLSGNPIAMAAGIATIDLISRPGFHDELNRRMTRLVEGLNAAAKKTGVAFCARALGGLGGMYVLRGSHRPEPGAVQALLSPDAGRRCLPAAFAGGSLLPVVSPYRRGHRSDRGTGREEPGCGGVIATGGDGETPGRRTGWDRSVPGHMGLSGHSVQVSLS